MNRLSLVSTSFFAIAALASCEHQPSPASSPARQNTRAQTKGDLEAEAGARLFKERKFVEAIPRLEQALDQPLGTFSKSIVLTVLGNCYCELDQFDKALAFHDRAIVEDPKNHKAYVNRGIVYRLTGQYDKAKESYQIALDLAPTYSEAHASMGTLALFQGDYDSAIKSLERAIELDDAQPLPHSNLALAFATAGRFEEADQELKKAVVRGYHQPDVIKKRIEELRKLSTTDE